jgi:hypothetical protein
MVDAKCRKKNGELCLAKMKKMMCMLIEEGRLNMDVSVK